MKCEDTLLWQLRNLDSSISDLKNNFLHKGTTVSDDDTEELSSSGAESVESDVFYRKSFSENVPEEETNDDKCNSADLTEQEVKIGNQLVTPISRVIAWLDNSDFKKAAEKECRLQVNTEVYKFCRRPRSLTYSETSFYNRNSSLLEEVLDRKNIVGNAPNSNISTMWKSDDSFASSFGAESMSASTETLFQWSRRTPAWRSFCMLDNLDNYLLNNVSSRLKFQPRPRLHRQGSFSDTFDVTFGSRSSKAFLAEPETCGRSERGNITIPIVVTTPQRETKQTIENSESVNEHHISDSGFDDSFEETEKDSETKPAQKSIVSLGIINPSINIEEIISKCDNEQTGDAKALSGICCAGREIDRNIRGDISARDETDGEISDMVKGAQDEEHFLTIHDGVVSCRIMSPNLERQISEQNDERLLEGFEFLTIEDGKVVFRSRDLEVEDDCYNLGELFEGVKSDAEDVNVAVEDVNGAESTDGESFCTAVTELSDQVDDPKVAETLDTIDETVTDCGQVDCDTSS